MAELHVSLTPVRHCFVALPRHLFTPPTVKDGPLTIRLEFMFSYARRTVWVGWGGLTCADGQIALPDRLAACFELKEDTLVTVALEPTPPTTKMVHVEPATVDDWEVLQLNAGFVEEHLVEQINVLSEGFRFPIWLGKTVIYFKLVSIEGKKAVEYNKTYARLVPYQSEIVVKPLTRAVTSQQQARGEEEIVYNACSLRVQPFWDQAANEAMSRDEEDEEDSYRSYSWDDGLKNRARARVVFVSSATYTKLNSPKLPFNGEVDAPNFFGICYNQKAEGDQRAVRRVDVVRVEIWHRVNDGHIMLASPLQELLGVECFSFVSLQRAAPWMSFASQKILSLSLSPVFWNQPTNSSPPLPSTFSWAGSSLDRWLSSLTEPVALTNGCILPLSPDDKTADDNDRTQHAYQCFVLHVNQPIENKDNKDNSKDNKDNNKESAVVVSRAISYYTFDMFTRVDFSTTGMPERPLNPHIQHTFLPWPSIGPPVVSLSRHPSSLRAAYERCPLCPPPPPAPLDLPALSTFPFVKLSGLAGTEEAAKVAVGHLKVLLFQPLLQTRTELGTAAPGGLLLCGPAGYGKTSLALGLASFLRHEAAAQTIWLSCRDLVGEKVSAVMARFSAAFRQARSQSPALLVLDDLDQLLPSGEDSRGTKLAELLADLMLANTSGARAKPKPGYGTGAIAVLATTNSLSSVHPAVTEAGLLTHKIDLAVPDLRSRERVMRNILKRNDLTCEADLEAFAADLEGYTPNDLQQLVQRVIFAACVRLAAPQPVPDGDKLLPRAKPRLSVVSSDFVEAKKGFVPSSLKDLTLHQSTVAWADVGGLDKVREVLKETLELPSRYARLFDKVPLKLRSGLLLYGPTGCGKTHLASAVAQECGLNFISIKGPELLNKYIGASEQAVRDAFGRAAACAPSILFFDEFESICPKRGGDSTGVTDRVVNQFLTFLDGVEARKGVYVLAASSRPDLIDPAILRPGRLDKPLYCGLPSQSERLSILQACTRKLALGEDVDLAYVAANTDNYTGSDLQALVADAMLKVVHEPGGSSLSQRQLLVALASSSSSLSAERRGELDRVYRKFVSSRKDQDDTFDANKPMRSTQAQ